MPWSTWAMIAMFLICIKKSPTKAKDALKYNNTDREKSKKIWGGRDNGCPFLARAARRAERYLLTGLPSPSGVFLSQSAASLFASPRRGLLAVSSDKETPFFPCFRPGGRPPFSLPSPGRADGDGFRQSIFMLNPTQKMSRVFVLVRQGLTQVGLTMKKSHGQSRGFFHCASGRIRTCVGNANGFTDHPR